VNLLAILGLGLLLGLRHAADPDHVVAVGAITARSGRIGSAAWIGAVWGAGHTLTLFAVGAAIILFNLAVPPRVGLAFELAVAVVLVVVGLLNLNRPHRHDDDLATAGGGRIPARRAFFVGTVHGLAGSAAVALLVLATVRDPLWACGYLLVFGAGTLLGMSLITVSFAAPLAAARRRWDPAGRMMRVVTGAVSVAFGAWLIWQIGWRDGLFRAVPHGTPR
jgi:high-affinity nickel-transport protein